MYMAWYITNGAISSEFLVLPVTNGPPTCCASPSEWARFARAARRWPRRWTPPAAVESRRESRMPRIESRKGRFCVFMRKRHHATVFNRRKQGWKVANFHTLFGVLQSLNFGHKRSQWTVDITVAQMQLNLQVMSSRLRTWMPGWQNACPNFRDIRGPILPLSRVILKESCVLSLVDSLVDIIFVSWECFWSSLFCSKMLESKLRFSHFSGASIAARVTDHGSTGPVRSPQSAPSFWRRPKRDVRWTVLAIGADHQMVLSERSYMGDVTGAFVRCCVTLSAVLERVGISFTIHLLSCLAFC